MNLFRPASTCMLLIVAALVSGFAAKSTANDEDPLLFGFAGPEIFPIDNLISILHVADLDDDGLNDLVVANNARSKIALLFNQTGSTKPPEETKPKVKRELNELPPDARFRIESIASEKRISAMVVADLNGDSKPDLAYYGEPKELVVHYNKGDNEWSTPKRFPIEDGQLSPNALAAGDLNGDGRTDLVLLAEKLAEKFVWFIAQTEEKLLGEPERIPFTGIAKSVQVVDVDGDRLQDLLLVNWESATPFRFRLQREKGQLGPEIYFDLPSVRAYWADNLRPKRELQLMTIAQQSGRAAIMHFEREPAEPLTEGFVQGQFEVQPLRATDKARRGVTWADIDGDDRADLLVAEPEHGQISVHFQEKDGSLASPRTFPSLAGISEIEVADWDGDGKMEIFLLSQDERQVGITSLDKKRRLPFPTLIPLTGKPLGLAAGSLARKSDPVLAILVDDNGRRHLVIRDASGASRTQALQESFRSNPSAFALHDVNEDKLNDLVVLIPYEKVKVLLQQEDRPEFLELDVAPPGGTVERPWFSTADVDGDGKAELLLNQRNFLRAVVLEKDSSDSASTASDAWVFRVREQINGAASNSRLLGAAAIPQKSGKVPLLFLLDVERKSLSLCERDASGVWQVIRNVRLPYHEFHALKPIALGGAKANAVGFIGKDAAAWMHLKGDCWEITELDGYETPIKDGYLRDVTSGDLNNDGQKDLVFLETARHYVDLVLFTEEDKLMPGNRWQVFEERTFRSGRAQLPEPREAAVADVTGDKKNDLIVVVHDRILVYPQE